MIAFLTLFFLPHFILKTSFFENFDMKPLLPWKQNQKNYKYIMKEIKYIHEVLIQNNELWWLLLVLDKAFVCPVSIIWEKV